jgi:N-acetylglucosamine-6-sulfatase
MKSVALPLASVALVVLVSLVFSGCMPRDTAPDTARDTDALAAKPNIVFILTDDMRKDDLRFMPKTRSVLKDKGMSFQNAFVSDALCCPARATIMRGQYAHNTKVWTNHNTEAGGWQAYRDNGLEQDNVATRLAAAGYRTALFGKYFNGYQNTMEVPLGWDRWFAHVNGDGYYDYQINDNGTIRDYGSTSADYETDVIANNAESFIGTSANSGVPFFAYVAPKAPHGPAIPAPRDLHAYNGLKAPRPPSFNEKDVSDKPPWIRQLPRLSAAEKAKIERLHEGRAELLQAVDDLVEGIVEELENAGVMDNTYIFFTSDNGFHHGEHRIPSEKWRPYEEDIHMPLLVRGPGVAAGSTAYELSLNTDYLPTFTDLAGAQTPPYVDGRSLRPALKGNATAWRSAILLEAARNDVFPPESPSYRGIRTSGGTKYVEYADGQKELYNLGPDPYELNNRYPATTPTAGQVSRLQALKICAADSCRAAENGQ